MKKKLVIISILLLSTISVYALNNNFNVDSSKLSFFMNSKEKLVLDNFSDEYSLTNTISTNNAEKEKEIMKVTKKATYLLIGDFGSKEESSEHYYKRHEDYLNMGAYNYFPEDENSESGYDESIPNALYASVSNFVVPRIFDKFNELEIDYSYYGDIRITINGNLAISSISLPNIKIKEENPKDLKDYNIIETNMVITYYFLEIDDEYRLAYLYAEYGDELDGYFTQLENAENRFSLQVASSYDVNLRQIYDFSKLDAIGETKINYIYNKNRNNIVMLNAYFNNYNVATANGFFINNGLIITTWSFMEKALIEAQYITVKDAEGKSYNLDGIVTANPGTDVVIIKLKEKVDKKVVLGDSKKLSIEDPIFTINSKTGIGLTLQKGIILSNDGYIQSAIPLIKSDEGSPLFDKEGNVVGINTSKQINTSISLAINSDVLKEAQKKFDDKDFDLIEAISFDKLKEQFYYVKYNDELVKNSIPNSKWKNYKKIGEVEKNIKLELVKASYEDGIVSLRYKNNISNYIGSMQFASTFMEQLLQEGYKEDLSSDKKCIYTNEKYQVIVMAEFNYLIIVMVRL